MSRLKEIEIAKIDKKIKDSLSFMLLGFSGAMVAGMLNILDCITVGSASMGFYRLAGYSILYLISFAICVRGFCNYSKLLKLKDYLRKID